MATIRTYLVSFNKAKRTDRGYYQITFEIGQASVNHEITGASFAELDAKIRPLAEAFGLPCSPYIRLKDRNERKPAGFDKWNKGLNIIEAPADNTIGGIADRMGGLSIPTEG